MPHPRELLNRIEVLLQSDYPPEQYRYVFEKGLAGTRILPDIQIFGPGNELACVVEIGYTRAEKIRAYREQKIPDVRWYGKDGILVNAVEREIEFETVRIKWRDEAPWRAVPVPINEVICEILSDEICRLSNIRESRSFWKNAWPNQILAQHEVDLSDIRRLRRECRADFDAFDHADYCDDLPRTTDAEYFTDGNGVFLWTWCDYCDEVRVVYGDDIFGLSIPFWGSKFQRFDAANSGEEFDLYWDRLRAKGEVDPEIARADLFSQFREKYNIELSENRLNQKSRRIGLGASANQIGAG